MEEENVRELRSSRSRSNTPLIRASRDRDGESIHGSEEGKRIMSSTNIKTRQRGGSHQKSNLTTVAESRTESITTQRYVNRRTGNESDSSTEHNVEDEQKFQSGRRSDRKKTNRRHIANGAMSRRADAVFSDKVKEDKVERTKTVLQKTSDYSSEEGEGVAYHVYKQSGDWWKRSTSYYIKGEDIASKFPKTDYTYSRISPHRKEVAPGVIVMPNMSRRSLNTMRQQGISSSESNLARSNTVTSVTKHHKSKSRWVDPSTSDIYASRKVYEEWAAVDSDVDDVADTFSKKSSSHVQKSWIVTTYVTTFFTTIWTFISSSYTRIVDGAYRLVGYPRDVYTYATPRRSVSPGKSEGRYSWFRKLFSWTYKVVGSVMHLDLLLLSSWHNTQIDQELEDYTETDSTYKYATTRKPKLWRLFLLLLPLLFLAGWWCMPESNGHVLNPILETSNNIKNTLIGWLFIPFEAYSALKEKLFMGVASPDMPPIMLSPDENSQEQKAVDMKSLASYILGSTQFQQQLASKIQAGEERTKLDKEHLVLSINQQNHFHQENAKMLEEHHKLLAQLTENLRQLQEKLGSAERESEKTEDREKEWELRWEKEKQSLREGMVSQSSVLNGDHVLLRKELRDLQSRFKLLQEQQAQMMRRCCQRGVVQRDVIEQHVIKILADLLGATGGQYSGNPDDLRAWVGNMILAKEDLEARLANLSATVHLHTREVVHRSRDVIMASVKEHIQNEFAKWQDLQRQHEVKAAINSNMGSWTSINRTIAGLSDKQVRDIVDEALAKYDADKTGLVDYALESSGGSILSTRCTEAYQAKTAKLTVLGIPLWYPSNNPRTVIQPGVHPGECWAFSGSQGFLVIRLSGLVQISGVSLEHIPRSLSPQGRIDSAPKDFTVWGLKEERDEEPVLLGRYTYRQNGTSLQNFSVQRIDADPFEIVELRIESNHGNMEYTCLYRFRVHGVLATK